MKELKHNTAVFAHWHSAALESDDNTTGIGFGLMTLEQLANAINMADFNSDSHFEIINASDMGKITYDTEPGYVLFFQPYSSGIAIEVAAH